MVRAVLHELRIEAVELDLYDFLRFSPSGDPSSLSLSLSDNVFGCLKNKGYNATVGGDGVVTSLVLLIEDAEHWMKYEQR